MGWTHPSFHRHLWSGKGYGGFGWYTDHYAGIALFRNIAYNNADVGITMYMNWEDAQSMVYNNLIVGSANGFSLGGKGTTQTSKILIKNSENDFFFLFFPIPLAAYSN